MQNIIMIDANSVKVQTQDNKDRKNMSIITNMTKTQKRKLHFIFLALLFLILGIISPLEKYWSLFFFIPGYLIIGSDTLKQAFSGILHGQVFDESFLMSIANIGAFALGNYPEAMAVMLFYQIGLLFESYAVDKSRKSIAELMDIRPDYANLLRDGDVMKVNPEEVLVGDRIQIKPGEKIPLDGKILEGYSSLDTSSLTGESTPKDFEPGDSVISGCINMTGVLTVEVSKVYSESTVSKILDLVENANNMKSSIESFITKFARYYTPIVVIVALILAVAPPLFYPGALFSDWVYRALTFLVISCPCALVISIPLSFFAGVGGASKAGILVKGSNYLEALAKAEIVVFDKTGTLTKGTFEVTGLYPAKSITEKQLLEMAAYAEFYSSHPISKSLRTEYGKQIDSNRLSGTNEIPGHGVETQLDGRQVLTGNIKLMKLNNISGYPAAVVGTAVYIALNGEYSGYILISDQIKPDSAEAVAALKNYGIKKTVMLTGDQDEIAQSIGAQAGIDITYSQLLPEDKVIRIEELLSENSRHGKLIFVGDGINDAPVLARADIGVAMGGLGADAAIEAADIVIMNDQPSKLITAIKIARKTLGIARQNVFFALAVKFGVLILGALGIATMWAAVFADVGVTVIAILNAMRALQVPK